MLVGVAMDARAMTSALATDSSYAAYAANAGAWLALGLLVGALHFLSLRWTVRLLAEGHSVALAAATQLARFAITAGVLVVAARGFGATALVAAALGIVIARSVVVRRGAPG